MYNYNENDDDNNNNNSKKNGLECTEEWYEHVAEGAVENEEVTLLWDNNVQYDNVIEARKPDIIVVDKREHKGLIIDIAVPAVINVGMIQKTGLLGTSRISRKCWKCTDGNSNSLNLMCSIEIIMIKIQFI